MVRNAGPSCHRHPTPDDPIVRELYTGGWIISHFYDNKVDGITELLLCLPTDQ